MAGLFGEERAETEGAGQSESGSVEVGHHIAGAAPSVDGLGRVTDHDELGVVSLGVENVAVRKERRAKTSAEALTAVEEYLEMPYRIRPRPTSPSAVGEQLTDEVSGPSGPAGIPPGVAPGRGIGGRGPYATLVATDSGMNLGVPCPPDRSNAARAECIAVMRCHLWNVAILVPTIPLLRRLEILVTQQL